MISPCTLPFRREVSRFPSLRYVSSLAFLCLWCAPAQATSPEHRYALKQMAARQQQQIQAAQEMKAFHGFQFADRVGPSGIAFEHRVVDDAAISYKAAHYDHGNGLAVADADGDGRLDLYFTTQIGSNQLWRNRGGGTFEDITARAGLGMSNQISVSASFADVDNDGDPDLFVTTVRHGNRLFENRGGGRFNDITEAAGLDYTGHSSGAAFFDFNNDGLLDLFLVNVGEYTTSERGPGGFYRAYPDAFSGHLFPERTEYSVLYQNMGEKKFKDVSRAMNLRDGSWSGDSAFADLNEDGYPDLYIVNMQGDDHYYENQQGKGFLDKTSEVFPKTPWGTMGVEFFDWNQDGRTDLYLTDMHSDMTQGQTMQALRFGLDAEKTKSEAFCSIQWTEEYLQGSSNNIFGNAFYENQGEGKFLEKSDSIGAETYWPWGFSVGDLNADGYEDLFVAAGMGYPFRYGVNSALLNDRGKKFYDSEFLLGIEPRGDGRTEKVWFSLDCDGEHRQHPECMGQSGQRDVLGTLSARSSVIIDYDGDGDLDIVTNDFNDRPQVLTSNLTEKREVHYLGIKLIGTQSNRDGLGAKVTVRTGGKDWRQWLDGKSGYLSQSSMPLYFGLGESKRVESVEVRWPSGKTQTITKGLNVNSIVEIKEE